MNCVFNKATIIVAISCLLVGRYVLTPKQKTKEVVKVVEVEKKRTDSKKKVVTREVTNPDGTKVKETTETENTVTDSERSRKEDKFKLSETGASISLGLLAIKDATDFSKPFEYGATVAVPVIGNLKAMGMVTTSKQIGLGLSVDF
jgi:hypothetical protein